MEIAGKLPCAKERSGSGLSAMVIKVDVSVQQVVKGVVMMSLKKEWDEHPPAVDR